ncbi:kinetochore protein NDC80 homolog isoform X2 [Malania oleifera]|uniref:kinetochore protein NDC80 homolog isoform X2 n=1 Tax=Malania oleifera TaxID=397392 RepID=UPI0025AEC979|nr:kinetochore protein NDC80 homolog isoform X2 [Malania oleifera]
MRGAGRRRQKDSFTAHHASQPPPPPLFTGAATTTTARDSDASFCSSRPSSVGLGRSSIPISDRGYQLSAIRTINAYLSSNSQSLSLKPPLPSAKDITETLRFVLSRLDYSSVKLDEDLPIILKHLCCPIKLNKSALRAPGTPHSWPSLLAVIHWLVQIVMYNDHLLNSSAASVFFQDNTMFIYALDSYLHYIRGDDDSVDTLDREFLGKLEQERDGVVENVKDLEKDIAELESKVDGLKSGPSAIEVMEKERVVLEEDVKKFHAVIDQFSSKIAALDKVFQEKERELGAKEEERKRICGENEELKKRVEEQTVNTRDAERMKRELQAVERDIGDADGARNTWEEKSWDHDTTLGHKFKELETLSIECNQAIRRLKLGNIQYSLSAKGSTPAEILGFDYKSTLTPALESFIDDIKRSTMAKLEEMISLRQQLVENGAKIEAKRNRIAVVQSYIGEVEAQLNLLKKEIEDNTSRCGMEARKVKDNIEAEAYNLDVVEREAAEILKTSKLRLEETIKQSEEEIQNCAYELFALVDSVSKYKEYMATKISGMNCDLSETAGAIPDAYRGSLPVQFGIDFSAIH